MKWTSEQDNRIAELLRAKKTAKEIAAELGVSRNAIIGRVTRCKMLREVGFARGSGEKTGDAATRIRKRIVVNHPKPLPKPVIVKPALVAPITAGKPLLECGHHRCKFAVTPHDAPKAGHLFCGEVTEIGKSWCAWHERIVWGRGTAGETATVKSAARIAA